MSSYIITIDGGTTNTRCILWNEQRKMLSDAKRDIGVRCTSIDGNNIRLTKIVVIRRVFAKLAEGNNL